MALPLAVRRFFGFAASFPAKWAVRWASDAPQLANRPHLPGSSGKHFPLTLNPPRADFPLQVNASDVVVTSETSAKDCALAVKDNFQKNLLKYGAILYRGFPIEGHEDFATFYSNLGDFTPMDYVGGAAVRKQVGKVFTASDEPPEHCIELHNEMAYLPRWPKLILFYCLVPAGPGCGGESGIADVRKVFEGLDPAVVEEFTQKGIRYHWHWQDRNPNYKSWQDVFWTEKKEDVDKYMEKNRFDHTWHDDGSLSYWFNRPAVIKHPETDELLWFNHITRKHASSWKVHPYWEKFDIPNTFYPSHALYGDGTEIDDDVVQHIRAVNWEVAVGFQMEKRDVLILENQLVQHSRLSFTGERKLLAALLN